MSRVALLNGVTSDELKFAELENGVKANSTYDRLINCSGMPTSLGLLYAEV